MFNLKSLILIALITFCHQDKNCLVYFEECEPKYDINYSGSIGAGSVANCQYGVGNECYRCKSGYVDYNEGKSCVHFPGCESLTSEDKTKCSYCQYGYALTSDQTECVKFDNCNTLVDGDKTKCKTCNNYFKVDKDGKCERTLCSEYESTNSDVCSICYPGYYLNQDKKCVEITLQSCLEVETSDNTKCKSCEGGYSVDNGQCVVPSTLIKGCIEYDKTGKCTACDNNYYEGPKSDGTCSFKTCQNEI